MSEHFTRTRDVLACWCYTCKAITDHAVSDENIGHCLNDHSKKKDPLKATIPDYNYAVGGVSSSESEKAIALALHMQALEGPTFKHDGRGNLPAKPEPHKKRRHHK